MRAAPAVVALLIALAGCLSAGTTSSTVPSTTGAIGTGPTSGQSAATTEASAPGLPGIVLHLDAYPEGDGRPGYRFVAVAVNHGPAAYDYREGCGSAWRYRIERAGGAAVPYGGPIRCQGFQEARLLPGNSTGDGDSWDGDAIDQGGNREQVQPGTYTWVATFLTEQGNATGRLDFTWPPA